MKALDLGSGRVFSTVCKLVFPAMIAQFINVLYSVVDRIYVGNIRGIGDTALAAVGVCAPVATLISSFAFLIGTGGAPLFAMALGEKKKGRAQKILINALLSLLVLSLAVTALVFALEPPCCTPSAQATAPIPMRGNTCSSMRRAPSFPSPPWG